MWPLTKKVEPKTKSKKRIYHYLDIYIADKKELAKFRVRAIKEETATEYYRDFIKWFHCRPQSKTFRLRFDKGSYGVTRNNIIAYRLETNTHTGRYQHVG